MENKTQTTIADMTVDDARAILQKLADDIGVSVENLAVFTKKGAKGDLITSPEQLEKIAKDLQVLSEIGDSDVKQKGDDNGR